jgi:hypothetical protein
MTIKFLKLLINRILNQMTRVTYNNMELHFNSAVFGSFTLYSAGLVNVSIARVFLVVFLTDRSGATRRLFK